MSPLDWRFTKNSVTWQCIFPGFVKHCLYSKDLKFRKFVVLKEIPVIPGSKLPDDLKQHLLTCPAGLKLAPEMETFL
jgi:hypothetical protein